MISACWLIGAYFLAVSSHKCGRLNTSVYGISLSNMNDKIGGEVRYKSVFVENLREMVFYFPASIYLSWDDASAGQVWEGVEWEEEEKTVQ